MSQGTSGGATLPPRLDLRGISKRFGVIQALDAFEMEIRPGEIHGLVGRNGSGKSTLIKILAGYHSADHVAGAHLDGEPLNLTVPGAAGGRHHIGFVHQDLALSASVSVLENMCASRWERTRLGTVSWRRARARVAHDLAAVGLDLDIDLPVRSFEMGTRALIAIARALGTARQLAGYGLLVLDEPTAALNASEVQVLFEALRSVARSGTSVLFVSHRLAEVFAITDRITVIRDGRAVARMEASGCHEDDVVSAILGRRLTDFYPARSESRRDVVLAVKGLSVGNVDSVEFDVRAGEIVGLTGLAGTGHERIPYVLAGVDPATAGQVSIGPRSFSGRDVGPAARISAGLVLIPNDRARYGMVPSFTIRENVSLPVLSEIRSARVIRRQAERRVAAGVVRRYGVNPANGEARLSELSGGNQQKVVIGKWLQRDPRVVVMHEPTQGVDVGAKRDIFDEIERVVSGGAAVVICSSEYEDLANLCHRVLVFGGGRMALELSGEMSGDGIAEECFRASLATSRRTTEEGVAERHG